MTAIPEIRRRLLNRGWALYRAPKSPYKFASNEAVNKLIDDLSRHPHAFVLGCVVDRQINAERAWSIPYRLKEKLGDFRFATLRGLSKRRLTRLMSKPEPLHRFPKAMAKYLYSAIRRIDQQYGGRANRIWWHKPSSATVVYRFMEFEGIGQKIATMATNILARRFKVEFSDYSSIDVSVDTHVSRVFRRLGLVDAGASRDQLIYRARASIRSSLDSSISQLFKLAETGAGKGILSARSAT